MSKIKEVFFRNIEENIAPVIYFHQLSPEVAAQEVAEYVFTTRPASLGNQQGGIHEQMVTLLNQISTAIDEGHKLPASWISGFFGSGKSSFAKLLGLALDKMELPDGKTMDQALMERDDTPGFQELREAMETLNGKIQSMAVIFDIGTAAKNNESIPHTIYRNILVKLGYSSHDGVAHYEVALEDEGLYNEFLSLYEEQYNKPWSKKRSSALAPQQFRVIYKRIFPEQDDLLETSTFNLNSLSIKDMVTNINNVINRRAPGKTIFIVVDEVSQYIAKDQNKMLDLQSFVSEIGGRVKRGRSTLWLLVTGQEKLEEESKDSVLFKLKDRFPPELRVHLDRSNVREIVSRRILKKKTNSELDTFITDAKMDSLKLHAYDCKAITKDEVIEHYPLLPGHIPLFMDITQSIRNRSIRTQSDAGGVRSVLNNIWDLFNRDPVALKDRELGTLMTLDMLYDIIGSSIDSDVQLTLHKVFEKMGPETWETRVIKSIALLEMNAEKVSVTEALLSSLLYPQLGSPTVKDYVEKALDNLNKDNWIHFHDKDGWHIQNNAAQDWNRQKSEISIPPGQIVDRLIDLQKDIMASVNQPTLNEARFPLEVFWGLDQKISGKNDPTKVSLCFHWISNTSRRKDLDTWINLSRQHKTYFHWLSGDTHSLESKVRDYEKSQRMISRYKGQGQLQPLWQQLIYREQADSDRLWEEVKKDLRQVWLKGTFFFAGDSVEMSQAGASFDNVLKAEIEKKIGQLYHKFSQGHISIPESEYRQLLDKDTSGLSTIFFEGHDKLGIAQNDAGKILFRCEGQVPKEIYGLLEERTYQTGDQLIGAFGAAPYGYSATVIKASVIGLLREERLRITDIKKNEITSIQDPGARSLFEQHREFLRCEIEVNKDSSLTGRDRNTLRQFFEDSLGLKHVDADTDSLADLVFKYFPELKDRISAMNDKLGSLSLRVPPELSDFNRALTECLANRHVQKTLERFKRNHDTISRGVSRLKELEEILNDDTERELRELQNVLNNHVKQLEQVGEVSSVGDDIDGLSDHMNGQTPWRVWADVKPMATRIISLYVRIRLYYKEKQLEALTEQMDQIKMRPDFADLDPDKQSEVISLLRKSFIDVDEEALQPTLLQVKQTPDRIREDSSEAHNLLDQLTNEAENGDSSEVEGDQPRQKIHTVHLGLRNKIISDSQELDHVLGRLKEQCIKELEAGAKVRLEE